MWWNFVSFLYWFILYFIAEDVKNKMLIFQISVCKPMPKLNALGPFYSHGWNFIHLVIWHQQISEVQRRLLAKGITLCKSDCVNGVEIYLNITFGRKVLNNKWEKVNKDKEHDNRGQKLLYTVISLRSQVTVGPKNGMENV